MKLQGVTKIYSGKTVLKDLDLLLENHEITCILGPSGCGKTTLLRVASGLEKPDAGTVSHAPQKASFVFQEDRLLQWYNILENLTVCSISRQRAEEALAAVGLEQDIHQRPESLSGGMKRRVVIARALAFSGDYFFLDEPCRGLDRGTKENVLSYIKAALKGKGALLITHDIEEAAALADKILIADGIPLNIKNSVDAGKSITVEEILKYTNDGEMLPR